MNAANCVSHSPKTSNHVFNQTLCDSLQAKMNKRGLCLVYNFVPLGYVGLGWIGFGWAGLGCGRFIWVKLGRVKIY